MDANVRQLPVLPRACDRSSVPHAPTGHGTSLLSLSDYELKEKVGQGAQGSVFRAIRKSTGECVALKQIDVTYMSERERSNALAEVKVLATIAEDPHPCVTAYQESFVAEGSLWIALEWSANGTLQDALNRVQRKERGEFDEDEVWHIFLSLLLALDHVHQMHILHRDVKMANVFLHYPESSHARATNGGFGLPRTQLGDFGVSTILDDRSRAHTMVGTPYYLSPELCMGKPYSSKSDIWSLGVILYVLLNQKMPYEASNYAALILRIVQQDHAKHHPASSRYSATLRNMTTWCLQKDEGQRPTANDLLLHPDCLRQVVRLALPASASLLARASVVPFGVAPLRRSKTVRQEEVSAMDAPQPSCNPAGRPPPRRQPLSALGSALPAGAVVGGTSVGKPLMRRKQRVITGASNPTARAAAVMATQQQMQPTASPLLAGAPGSRVPASRRHNVPGSAQPKPLSVLQAMGVLGAVGGTAGRPTSATSPLVGGVPGAPRSSVLKRASDVAAVHRLPNIGDDAGGSSEEELPGRPAEPLTTGGGRTGLASPDGRRRVYSYERRMLREDPERCLRLLGASAASLGSDRNDVGEGSCSGLPAVAGGAVQRNSAEGKLASHDRYLDHVHSWREEDRPCTRGTTSYSTETISLLRKHNLAPSAMLAQFMREDDVVVDEVAHRSSADSANETAVVVDTRRRGSAVARTWDTVAPASGVTRGGEEASRQFLFAQHSLTTTMAELDVKSTEADPQHLSRQLHGSSSRGSVNVHNSFGLREEHLSTRSTIPDESPETAFEATSSTLPTHRPVGNTKGLSLELYGVEDNGIDDDEEVVDEAYVEEAQPQCIGDMYAVADESGDDSGYGEAASYASPAGQSPPVAGFGEAFEEDGFVETRCDDAQERSSHAQDDEATDGGAGQSIDFEGGAVGVFWRVDDDSGTSSVPTGTSKRSDPAARNPANRGGRKQVNATVACSDQIEDVPTETFGSSALLLERVGELFHAGEALVGERGFAEVIELLTRDTPVSSSELQEFVACRTRTPQEASELLYVSFRFVMLNGELLKLRREKKLSVARQSYLS